MKIKEIAGLFVGIFIVDNTIHATVTDGQDLIEDDIHNSAAGRRVIDELKKEFWEVFKAPDSEQSNTIHLIDVKPIRVWGTAAVVIIVK